MAQRGRPKLKRRPKAGKGPGYERATSKRFSIWASGGKSLDIFWRTPGSGARRTAAFKRSGVDHRAHGGDLLSTDPRGYWLTQRFYFEFKFYKELAWVGLLRGNEAPNLFVWWQKLIKEAAEVKKDPVMVVKGNNGPDWLIVPPWVFAFFDKYSNGTPLEPSAIFYPGRDLPPMVVTKLTQLFERVNYSEFRKSVRRRRERL